MRKQEHYMTMNIFGKKIFNFRYNKDIVCLILTVKLINSVTYTTA